jgi:Putative peptidoglycan binding domain
LPFTRAHFRNLAVAMAVVLLSTALCSARGTTTTTSTTHKSPAKRPVHHATPAHKYAHTSGKGKKSRTKYASRKRGQQKIDPERAQQIQQALIREHYLSGKASGTWDAATQQAMQKYQADNGWQSKTTPDSRALIKLGLGPDQRNLLNPESAMTSGPQTVHAAPDPAKAPDPADPVQPQNQQQ